MRQHESYLSIPIVFLSTEGDLDQQMRALALGGDEFLTKPIETEHLVAMRQTDLIARYGGDEFAAVLPNTRPAAVRLIEEIGASFAQLSHLAGDERFTATISAGISSYPESPTVEQLTAAADNALYRSKSRGRNRVTLWGSEDVV